MDIREATKTMNVFRVRDLFGREDLAAATRIVSGVCQGDGRELSILFGALTWNALRDGSDVWIVGGLDEEDVADISYFGPTAAKILRAHPYHPLNVTEHLRAAIKAYQHQRSEYWQIVGNLTGHPDVSGIQDICALAEPLIEGVGDLVSPRSVASAHDAIRQLGTCTGTTSAVLIELRATVGTVLEEVTLHVASETTKLIDTGAGRVFDLLFLLEPMEPSEPAAQFLRRVSRCYVFGFDVECAVMCRAVLDAEFADQVSDHACRLFYRVSDERVDFNLMRKINVAFGQRRISGEAKDFAHEVRLLGNALVHERPDKEFSALETVKKTLRVIQELHNGNQD